MSDENQDNAHPTDAPGDELALTNDRKGRTKPINRAAILSALHKLRGGDGAAPVDSRAESRAVADGEELGEARRPAARRRAPVETGAMDQDLGDEPDLDQDDQDLGLDGETEEGEGQDLGDADDAPPEADEPEDDEVELDQEAAAKLRIRQETQRLRAKHKAALEEAAKERAAAAEERALAARERAEAEAQRKADEDKRKRAAQDPYKFLEELTGENFDDLVRGKLEEGTPDAKIASLQKKFDGALKAIQAINDGIQREKDEAVLRPLAQAHRFEQLFEHENILPLIKL